MRTAGFFRDLVSFQKGGIPRGICSVCSAHRTVLEAAFLHAGGDAQPVLVESTVNQVNQFGGYTGMTPVAFRLFVASVAEEMGFPRDRIMLGGDHLGPYPWKHESADVAMKKSRDLVAASVRAGYAKIHLDASMPLGGDRLAAGGALDPRVAAAREAELAATAEAAFRERADSADAPVYVIGTEVPAPGGVASSDEVSVTRAEDLLETVSLCREAFADRGLQGAWERVRAVVAQPGVEYGDQDVHRYERVKAARLCDAARRLPGIVLEGHSTDYQTVHHLRELVEDGVAILKVGPALTFALRECLFGLECIEREMARAGDAAPPSNLREAVEQAMTADPSHWRAYYTGSDAQRAFARKFSLLDRVRYYWGVPAVAAAVERLFSNLGPGPIPMPLISQYLPIHHDAVRSGGLSAQPRALVRESVRRVIGEYAAATRGTP